MMASRSDPAKLRGQGTLIRVPGTLIKDIAAFLRFDAPYATMASRSGPANAARLYMTLKPANSAQRWPTSVQNHPGPQLFPSHSAVKVDPALRRPVQQCSTLAGAAAAACRRSPNSS